MEGAYIEVQCIPHKTRLDRMKNILTITAIVVCIILIVFIRTFFFSLAALVIAGALCIYLYINRDIEYEYIYCDGRLDFDRISNKSRRKTLVSMDIPDQLERCCLKENFKEHSASLKRYDFSSHDLHNKVYCLIVNRQSSRVIVEFEPGEELLALIRRKAPGAFI